jgi:hypothetical protein
MKPVSYIDPAYGPVRTTAINNVPLHESVAFYQYLTNGGTAFFDKDKRPITIDGKPLDNQDQQAPPENKNKAAEGKLPPGLKRAPRDVKETADHGQSKLDGDPSPPGLEVDPEIIPKKDTAKHVGPLKLTHADLVKPGSGWVEIEYDSKKGRYYSNKKLGKTVLYYTRGAKRNKIEEQKYRAPEDEDDKEVKDVQEQKQTPPPAPDKLKGTFEIGSLDDYKNTRDRIKASGQTVAVVKFSADNCGPCKMIAPTIHSGAESEGVPLMKADIPDYTGTPHGATAIFPVSSYPSVYVIAWNEKQNAWMRISGPGVRDDITQRIQEAKRYVEQNK